HRLAFRRWPHARALRLRQQQRGDPRRIRRPVAEQQPLQLDELRHLPLEQPVPVDPHAVRDRGMSMLKKVLGAAVLAGAAMLATTGAAGAATGPDGAPTAADTAAIGQVTGGPATLGRLASTKFPGARAAAAVTAATADPRTQVAVYEPTAAFVTGKSDVPAA